MKALAAATKALKDSTNWAQEHKTTNGFLWDVAVQLGIIAVLAASGWYSGQRQEAIPLAIAIGLFAIHEYLEFSLLAWAVGKETKKRVNGTPIEFANFGIAMLRITGEALLSWRNKHWLALPAAAILLFSFAPQSVHAGTAGILMLGIYAIVAGRNLIRLSIAPLYFIENNFRNASACMEKSRAITKGHAADLAVAYAVSIGLILALGALAETGLGLLSIRFGVVAAIITGGVIAATAIRIAAIFAYASVAWQQTSSKN